MITINTDEFDNDYTLVKNHIASDASYNGCLFETYGDELDHVWSLSKKHPNRVWTVHDDGVTITSGFHVVNRLGYLITDSDAKDDIVQVIDEEELEYLKSEGLWEDD